jgi:transcriptional regulator with XRE-family HTH domain
MTRQPEATALKTLNARIGANVERCRCAVAMSVSDVEAKLLLSAGTLRRMEQGFSGFDPGMLIALSGILDTPVSSFFQGLPTIRGKKGVSAPPEDRVEEMSDFLAAYHTIENTQERRRILSLVRSVAESGHY